MKAPSGTPRPARSWPKAGVPRKACAGLLACCWMSACNLTDGTWDPSIEEPGKGDEVFGGQTGDGSGAVIDSENEDMATSQVAGCPPSDPKLLDVDEVAGALEFSAADLMNWVSDGIASSATWDPHGGLVTSPESGDAALEINFESTAKKARLYRAKTSENDAEESGVACAPWLELDAVVHLRTSARALDEQFPVTLRAARSSVVGFSGTLRLDELQGRLKLDGVPADAKYDHLQLEGVVSPLGSQGWVQLSDSAKSSDEQRELEAAADVERAAADLPTPDDAGPATLLVWPSVSDCGDFESGGFLVPNRETVFGQRVVDWQAVLGNLADAPVFWSDGGKTTLSLDVEASGKSCYQLRWDDGWERLSYAAKVTARTDDSRWAGEYDAVAFFDRFDGEAAVVPSLGTSALVPVGKSDQLGVKHLRLEGAEQLSLSLSVTTSEDGERVQGNLLIYGSSPIAECGGEARAPDECGGESFQILYASIGNPIEVRDADVSR